MPTIGAAPGKEAATPVTGAGHVDGLSRNRFYRGPRSRAHALAARDQPPEDGAVAEAEGPRQLGGGPLHALTDRLARLHELLRHAARGNAAAASP